MAKYHYRAVQHEQSWTAEIIRRKTAKEVIVTKGKDGFGTEDEAREWGESELKNLMASLNARKRRSATGSR